MGQVGARKNKTTVLMNQKKVVPIISIEQDLFFLPVLLVFLKWIKNLCSMCLILSSFAPYWWFLFVFAL